MEKGIDYIVVDELPIDKQEPLKEWLIGKTLPSIEGYEGMCCYGSDYNNFLKYVWDKKLLLTKYFKGWIQSENMNTEEWYDVTYNAAKKSKEEGCEIIMFRVPKNKNGVMSKDLINQIENMLQEKLK